MLKPHVVPSQLFDSVAAGEGGTVAGRWLTAAERSKQHLLLRGVLDSSNKAGHPALPEIRRSYQVLADIQVGATTKHAVEAVLRQPAVACWAIHTIRSLAETGVATASPERIVTLAAAAALRARVAFRAETAAEDGQVVIPSLGVASFSGLPRGARAEIVVTPSGAEIRAGAERVSLPYDRFAKAEGWEGMRCLDLAADGMRLRLGIDDFDPYRFAFFPDVAPRLIPDEVAEWADRMGESWRLLVRRHRRFAAELQTMITVVTPLKADSGEDKNATSREVFGCIGLSRPRSAVPTSLALALAHEVQHAKLAALLDLVTLVRPRSASLYYAPWREDPRPPQALLHGAYAFLGVARFWRRQREHERGQAALYANSEYARWREASAEAVSSLSRGPDMTALGQRFLWGMTNTFRQWQDE